jgi:NAD(P)-dependent dehydrogenase (short-subunit alcohol dehydrogenase family)
MPALVVTGGSRGIGRAIVLEAARQGYDVAFTYSRNSAAAEDVVTKVEQTGRRGLAIRADAADQNEVIESFNKAYAFLGRLDALVANAGIIGEPRSIFDADAEHLSGVFAVNVLGVFYAISAGGKIMSSQNGGAGGTIVVMSSAAARHGGLVAEAHYASSKGALDSLTLALAKELPPHGIRINAVRPGLIHTDIHDVHGGDQKLMSMGSSIPLARVGEPSEVATAVLFLLSPNSAYIHGAILDVSGGR